MEDLSDSEDDSSCSKVFESVSKNVQQSAIETKNFSQCGRPTFTE